MRVQTSQFNGGFKMVISPDRGPKRETMTLRDVMAKQGFRNPTRDQITWFLAEVMPHLPADTRLDTEIEVTTY